MNKNDPVCTATRPKAAALLLAAGLAFLIVTGCNQKEGEAETALPDAKPSVATAPVAPPVAPPVIASGPARMQFEKLTYDFGRVAETVKHRGQLSFTNTGGSELVIGEIKTTCGCTAVALEKRQYAPGESGTLEIEFDPVAPGDQKKYINVKSNDESSPITKITMVADVIAFITIEPRMVKLETLRQGEEHHVTVTVSNPDPNFTLDSVTTSNPSVTARVVGGEGTTRTLDLTIDAAAPWGGLFSWLNVTVTGRPTPDDEPLTHTSRVRVQGKVFGDLTANPDTYRFGAKPGEVFERKLVLRRPDGKSFRVLDAAIVTTDLPTATVRVDPVAAGAYEIVLIATAPTRLAQYRGTVEITTDVPGEETLRVPVSGVVRN